MAYPGFRSVSALAFCCVTLSAGCASMNQPYPAKQRFALMVEREQAGSTPSNPHTLRVREFRVAPPYHELSFVYRKHDSEFETDYYREFVAPPATLLTSQTIAWMSGAHLFGRVLPGSSAADNEYLLEATVTALYGDYRNRSAPEAVMELQVFVLVEQATLTNVVFERTYRHQTPIRGAEPADLVNGWKEALRAILTDLEGDLRAEVIPRVTASAKGSTD
jgi:cholesterol transport system auxiliary component